MIRRLIADPFLAVGMYLFLIGIGGWLVGYGFAQREFVVLVIGTALMSLAPITVHGIRRKIIHG